MKYALIIGNNKYDDPRLAQLKTPAADSHALAQVLSDKDIGSFDEVKPLVNKTEAEVRRAISSFMLNRKPDDLVLVYFSGHGVLDERGRLFLGLKDTQTRLLMATAIPSTFISDEMDSCRSKRQILVLDCCHSGAFARGTKGDQKAITETTFEGSGFGRVVLTASDSTQYALEGDQVITQTELSLFTHFLLEGLKTGEADMNNDGAVSLDEWYDYTYGRVVSETPRQVPHKWSYNQQGDLIIARNPHVKKKVVELPAELLQALESSFVGIRESAVNELGKYLRSREPEMVRLAVAALEKMKADDSRRISIAAENMLAEYERSHVPTNKAVDKPARPSAPAESKPRARTPKAGLPAEDPQERVKARPALQAGRLQPSWESMGSESKPGSSVRQETELLPESPLESQWIWIAVAAVLFSLLFFSYELSEYSASDPLIVVLFAAVAGLTSLIQWSVFRQRLKVWWVGANILAGIGLGMLHNILYNTSGSGWWSLHLGILLAVWLVANLFLGRTFAYDPLEDSKSVSSESAQNGAHPNIFMLLLEAALVCSAVYSLIFAADLPSLLNPSLILYGMTAIAAVTAFALKQGRTRNIGLVTLAVFLLIDGINSMTYYSITNFPLYLFSLSGFISLACAVFLLFRRPAAGPLGFLLLCGYLISVSVSYFSITNLAIYGPLSIISALLAVPAAIFLFLNK